MNEKFPEIVTNPELIRANIRSVVDKCFPTFRFPLKFGSMSITDGNVDTMDCAGVRTEFSEKDLDSKTFVQDVKDVYEVMGWNIVDRLWKDFIGELKQCKPRGMVRCQADSFTPWSKSSNPYINLGFLCEDIDEEDENRINGYRLDTFLVCEKDFYKFVTNSIVKEKVDEEITKIKGAYEAAVYLKGHCDDIRYSLKTREPGIWVIGVPDDILPEGSLIGICSYERKSGVNLYVVVDRHFGSIYKKDNILGTPINVRVVEDENSVKITAWLKMFVDIEDAKDVFCLENVI